MSNNSAPKIDRGAVVISLAYMGIGFTWIFVTSGLMLMRHGQDWDMATLFEIFKGCLYVLVTGIILFVMLLRYNRNTHINTQQLKDNSIELSALFDKALVGIAKVGLNGRFMKVNQQLCDYFGYTEAEMLNLTFEDITHEDDLLVDLEVLKKFNHNEQDSYVTEKRYVTKSGEVKWMQLKVNLIKDDEGLPSYFISAYVDITQRKEAEKALLENSRYYQTIMEHTFEGITVVSVDGNILYQTPSIIKITGYSFFERKGYSILDLISPEYKEEAARQFQHLAERPGNKIHITSKIINKAGDERVMEVFAMNMADNPVVNAIVINFRDVTEKYNAEESLKESEEKYRLLFLQNPLPIIIFDIETNKILDVNTAAITLYGYSLEEFTQLTVLDIRPARELPRFKKLIEEGQRGFRRTGPWTHVTKSGREIQVEVSSIEISYQARTCRLALMNDITEQSKAREILEKSEQQYRDLVEHLPAGAVLLEGDKLFFNKETEKITGYSREEIATIDDWFKTLYVDDHEYVRSLYVEDKAQGFPTERTVTLHRKNGELRWVTFYAYQFATGEVWLLWDISQQKISEEKIYTSIIEGEDRERQRIASELHDGLGQQLTAALLNLHNMQEAVAKLESDKQMHFQLGLNFLNKAIEESRNIAHNLMPMSVEDFGLIYSLESLFSSIRKTTKLEISLYESVGPSRLSRQIETNLFRITQEALNNVIKHARAKQVSVQLIKHPRSLIYSFEDDGTGFDVTTKPEMQTGMGLNNIYNRVKSMSGELNIDSKPGYGTIITIELQL